MRVLNLSFYAVKSGEMDDYLRRHEEYRSVFDCIASRHHLTHVHLCRKNFRHPPGTACDRFIAAWGAFPLKLIMLAAKLQPDVVFLHSVDFPLQTLALRIFLVGRKTRVVILNHAEKPAGGYLKRIAQRIAYKNVAAFLFTSRRLAIPFLKARIITDKTRVFEVMEMSTRIDAIDRQLAKDRLSLNYPVILLWVGRLNGNKDPMTVLRALASLRERNWRLFMIYGESTLEAQVGTFIRKSRLETNVVMKGYIRNEELAWWYSAADYYVSASHYEGSGVALCEAMACDCVPVVTDIPSFGYMTNDGECAYLFPAGDHQALARILQKLIEGSATPLSKKPRQVFDERLSYAAISRQLAAHLESL